MKALRFGILAAFLASFVTSFGVSRIGAKEIVQHRIEITGEFKNGSPVKDGDVEIFRERGHFILGMVHLDEWGTGIFQMPDVQGKYCFRATYGQRRSDNECYEDEYPATVKLTIL